MTGATDRVEIPRRMASGIRSTLIGVVANSLLAVGKFTAGILGNSYALVADGMESTLDIFSSPFVIEPSKR